MREHFVFISHVKRIALVGCLEEREIEIVTAKLSKGDLARGLSYLLDWVQKPRTHTVTYTLHPSSEKCDLCAHP